MSITPVVYRHAISFEIPTDDFYNIIDFEQADGREFSLPALSTIIDQIEGVYGTEYNLNCGFQITTECEVDEDGKTPQVEQIKATIEDYIVDVGRVRAIMPEILQQGRHDVELAVLYDTKMRRQVYREMRYCDKDFLITTGEGNACSIFHRADGELVRVDVTMPMSVREKIDIDRELRSFNKHKRLIITMSKGIDGVREWVSKVVSLHTEKAAVDISGHPLENALPGGAQPILRHKDFIVADHGRDVGLSVTFVSEDEVGTKWFIDAARMQILEKINQTGSNNQIHQWIIKQLPDDVTAPRKGSRHP